MAAAGVEFYSTAFSSQALFSKAFRDYLLRLSALPLALSMQVHDELVFEIREEKLEEYIALIKEKMSGAAELDVPLVVEAGTGDNWDQAH